MSPSSRLPRASIQITVYVTPETLARLELLAESLAPEEALSKQVALRIALARGLDELLQDKQKKPARR